MWSGALDSSDLLLSYLITSLSSPTTNMLISTLKFIIYTYAAYDNTLTALSADVRALSEELEEADVQIVALREENSKLGEAAAGLYLRVC